MSLLLALTDVTPPTPPAPPAVMVGAGQAGRKRKKYRIDGKDYDEESPELVKALQEALREEVEEPVKKRVVTRIAKGVPVYRVEFPEYPKFEAKIQEFRYNGHYEIAQLAREMLQRQRDNDEEDAIIALIH